MHFVTSIEICPCLSKRRLNEIPIIPVIARPLVSVFARRTHKFQSSGNLMRRGNLLVSIIIVIATVLKSVYSCPLNLLRMVEIVTPTITVMALSGVFVMVRCFQKPRLTIRVMPIEISKMLPGSRHNLLPSITIRITTFNLSFHCLPGMSNKKAHWLHHFVSAAKILITILTFIIYFHYFSHQSWGYFTIDPKQPLINMYAVSHQGIVSPEPVLKNNTSYGMGISRKGVFLYNKLADIIAGDKNLVWKKLNIDSLSANIKNSNDIGVINYNDFRIGRGRFVITKTERVPFPSISENKKYLPAVVYTLTDIR